MTAEEPVMVSPDMSSYADVMMYLHTVHLTPEDRRRVAQRLNKEVSEPALSKAYERIEHISTMRDGWAGDGSLAVSHNVLNNIRRVLLISNNADWINWMISPNTNATLSLQSKKPEASISLGAWEFSYYAEVDGREYGESHVEFTPEAFLKIVRQFG